MFARFIIIAIAAIAYCTTQHIDPHTSMVIYAAALVILFPAVEVYVHTRS